MATKKKKKKIVKKAAKKVTAKEQTEREALQKKSDRAYRKDVIRTAKSNHIWLNGFSCIRPTDEFKLDLANSILAMLQQDENTILTNMSRPGYVFETVGQRELILSINKS